MARSGLPTSLLRASGAAVGVPGAVVMAAWATGSLGALGLYAPTTAYETAAAAELPAAAAVPDRHDASATPTTPATPAIPAPVPHPRTARAAHPLDHPVPTRRLPTPAGSSGTAAGTVPVRPASHRTPHPVSTASSTASSARTVAVRPAPAAPVTPAAPPVDDDGAAGAAEAPVADTSDTFDAPGTSDGAGLPVGRVSVLSFG